MTLPTKLFNRVFCGHLAEVTLFSVRMDRILVLCFTRIEEIDLHVTYQDQDNVTVCFCQTYSFTL